jgi:hypothetical protein
MGISIGRNLAPCAGQRGHEAFAEFPLRRFFLAAAQIVEDIVQ